MGNGQWPEVGFTGCPRLEGWKARSVNRNRNKYTRNEEELGSFIYSNVGLRTCIIKIKI